MKILPTMLAIGALTGCAPAVPNGATLTRSVEVTGESDIEIGRYLVRVGGCNDCHTSGFLQADGKLPESVWLKGNDVGFSGPWGVTYASNLRLTAENISEDDWAAMLGERTGAPPMPWPATHAMTDANRRSLYRYIRALGPSGDAAPARLPPGVKPQTPYTDLTPVVPGRACDLRSAPDRPPGLACS